VEVSPIYEPQGELNENNSSKDTKEKNELSVNLGINISF